MADENIDMFNLTNSDGSKTYRSSLNGVRYTNTNIGAAPGGVDIALGATGILIQTGTNNQPTQQNTAIYDNLLTNSIGDPLAPTTTYSTDLMTIAKLDSTIPAIQIASSSSTLTVNNTIEVVNGAIVPFITCNPSNQLQIDSNNNDLMINSGSSNTIIGDAYSASNSQKITVNNNHYLIDLNCINLTANNDTYTYPICFSSKQNGSINYNTPGSFQDVLHYNINFPSFVMDVNTKSSYTDWKIEFALNCRNMTDQSNKELAIYFELEDAASTIYTPFLFNSTTPYTNYKNASSFPLTPQSENYIWTDYVNLNGVNNNVPLLFRLYWFANSNNNFDFNLLVSFTRTNIV